MGQRDPYRTNTGIYIRWITVRKKSVYLLSASVLAVGTALALWMLFFGENASAGPDPVEKEPGKAVVLVAVQGTVKVRKANSYQWIDAYRNMELGGEDRIQTAKDGEAQVLLLDGTMYRLGPLSILVIESIRQNTEAETKNAILLTSGQVAIHSVEESDWKTPRARGTAGPDTEGTLVYDERQERTDVVVLRGRVQMQAGEQEVTVESGQRAVHNASNRLKVSDLPGVPTTASPPDHAELPPGKAFALRWRSVKNAKKYFVVLDRSPEFPDPILQSVVSGTSVTHEGLNAGTYYWQVTAIYADDERGAPSGPSTFTVTRPFSKQPPDLVVYTPDVKVDGLVTVEGRTDPGARVTIDFGLGDEPVSVREDGSFTAYVRVRRAGSPLLVRARNEAGGMTEKTVHAILRNRLAPSGN
ncbi:MAG TPA: hypothetical protein VEK15_17550 [Vicinamibacteria bacterium]|nr:hypothetical protein [Vicinamibacteria bacterium]